MKKTVLVTGASGFVGQKFVEAYSGQFNVIPVCLIATKPEDLDFRGVDAVLHLAAMVHQMKPVPDDLYFDVNTKLTERVALAAKAAGVRHFVFYSTVKVFGVDGEMHNHNLVLGLNSPCIPTDAYGRSKLAAEKLLSELESEQFRLCIIRPPLVYGPNVKGNLKNLIKLAKFLPVLPLKYTQNKRSLVSLNNLLEQTAYVINCNHTGVVIPQDSTFVSTHDIISGVIAAQKSKNLLIKPPRILLWCLERFSSAIATRLFGTLAFDQSLNLRQREYLFRDEFGSFE